MKRKVKIKIEGIRGAGKSVIADVIRQALIQKGCKVNLKDGGRNPSQVNLSIRLDAEVEIEVVQA